MESIPMIRLNRHVKDESTLLKWFKQVNGNVLDKMSVLGLIKTEEVAVA